MSVKEMIFNSKKWLPVAASEQALIVPQRIKVSNWTGIGDYGEGSINGGNSSSASFKSADYIPVYGMKNSRYIVLASDGLIGWPGTPSASHKGDKVLISVDSRACQIQNGGVLRNLIRAVIGLKRKVTVWQ